MSLLDAIVGILFWAGLLLLIYAEVGYLGLLWLIARVRRAGPAPGGVEPSVTKPSVTLAIAAHNEEAVIRGKLENTLALAYPREKLSILVVSDGSTDGTDRIAREFAHRGVALFRTAQRGGKVPALRAAEPQMTTDIVLFSDADSDYAPDALAKLVRHFGDPAVGAVSGHETRVPSAATGKGKGEGLYVRLDNAIKALEGRVGSQVMVNGGFFAIRRSLLPTVPDHLTHDAVVPALLYLQGYRTAYEPDAHSTEVYALDSSSDFRRRVRTILQASQSYWHVRAALNPLRTGFYALQIWSHRFLRWLVLPLLAVVLVASLWLAPRSPFYAAAAVLQAVCYALALGGWALDRRGRRPAPLYFPFYFLYVHAAALSALVLAVRGKTMATWRPTQRETRGQAR